MTATGMTAARARGRRRDDGAMSTTSPTQRRNLRRRKTRLQPTAGARTVPSMAAAVAAVAAAAAVAVAVVAVEPQCLLAQHGIANARVAVATRPGW